MKKKYFLKEKLCLFLSHEESGGCERRKNFGKISWHNQKSFVSLLQKWFFFHFISFFSWKIMLKLVYRREGKHKFHLSEDAWKKKFDVTWTVYKTSLVHKYSLWVGRNLFIASDGNILLYEAWKRTVNYYYFRWNLIDKSDCDGVGSFFLVAVI